MEVEKLAIAKLELKAGDTLVVKTEKRQPREVLERLREHVGPHLPEGVKILVIDPSVTLSVLTAADPVNPEGANDLVTRAREFAREKHSGQRRAYTGEPHLAHLEEVAGLVQAAGLSHEAIAVAWLHDTVEDTSATLVEILEQFGRNIAVMVRDLTSTPPIPGENRDSRQAVDRAKLADAWPETQGIKCADLISNTSTIVKHDPGFAKRYLPEKRAILDVLTRAPPPLRDQAWASLIEAEQQLEAVHAAR